MFGIFFCCALRLGSDFCPLQIKGVLIDIREPTTEKQFVTGEEKKDLQRSRHAFAG